MRHHYRLGKLILAFVPVLAVLGGLAYSPLLRVERITVIGPPSLVGEVQRRLRVPAEPSMLFYPLCRISRQARTCYRVDSVRVDRVFPHELVVRVTMREPLAALGDDQGYTLLSGEGICLYRTARRPQLPVFRGLAVDRPPLGCQIPPERWEWAREVMAGATKAGIRQGLECDFAEPYRISLVTAEGLRANLGNVNSLTRKVTIMGRVLEQVRRQGRRVVLIDVSSPDSPIWTLG